MKIEVECRSVEDAREAAKAGSDVIMLDNFTPAVIGRLYNIINVITPNTKYRAALFLHS